MGLLSIEKILLLIESKINCIFLLLLLISCGQNPKRVLTIESEKKFDSIPSASGLAVKDTVAYVICDDGTGIYKVNLNNFNQIKIAINGLHWNEYREPKSIKHDLESACFVKWKNKQYLVALGSGSSNTRDSMFLLNIDDYVDQKMISLNTFYKHLQQVSETDSMQWNIEGMTIAGDSIIILNRGNNLFITAGINAFFSFMTGEQDSFPQVKYRKPKLPLIEKHEARFSGVCTVDADLLFFCASVEDTPDWTKDGPVLGSYFGLYSLKNDKIVETYLFKDEKGKALKEKIESVDLLRRTAQDLIFLATGDNDNGASKLFQLHLREFKQP
jgi:hypothetical protein